MVLLDTQETAYAHPAVFLNQYGQINDPNDPGKGAFPFALWPWQNALLDLFVTERRIIILKARQLGVSWLLAGYALWTFLAKPGSTVLLISKREHEASELLRKATFMYRRLPENLKFAPNRRDIDSSIRFYSVSLESNLIALPANPDAARSWTATLVMPDEWASQEYAREMYGSYEPTLGLTGQVIGCSTAKGPGGFFYDLWNAAKKGQNGYTPVFLPWHYRPGRTVAWREEQARQFEAQGTPEITASEFPEDELEAFGSSINLFFPLETVRACLGQVKSPVESRMDGEWRIYKQPRFAGRYVIGADVAEGITGRDYSTAAVLDSTTGEHVSSLRCRVTPDLFAAKLAEVGTYYHNALIAPERNNHGILTVNTLEHLLRYRNLYRPVKTRVGVLKTVGEAGWLTNLKTKPEMLIQLRQAMADGSFVSPCNWFATELQYFRQKGMPPERVTYEAAPGNNDDMVIATAIAWAIRPLARGERGVRKTVPLSR